MRKEDTDIKIFTTKKTDTNDSGILASVEGMNHHRQNGNVEKAKTLGSELGTIALETNKETVLKSEFYESKDIYGQVCALSLFSAEAALNYYLPSQQLSAIAINSLHEKLSECHSEVYQEVLSSPAFSFYYLSVRKGGSDIPNDIGEAFAMLCRQEGNVDYIEEGKSLYTKVLHIVESKIAEIKFAN